TEFQSLLDEFLTIGVLAFLLTFVRIGTAVMIMPGLGDSFVPERLRLMIALGLTLALFPLTMPYMPSPVPATFGLLSLIFMEFVVGLFFGTIARIFMTALDTAGMVISTASGLGNAQVFNPSMAVQGSLVGAFLSVTGVLVLFSLNLHHMMIAGLVESYKLFPIGEVPEAGSMAEFMARTVSASFAIGVKIGAPFIILTLLIYVGMGVLSRLMPQVQVFLLALPVQILLSVLLMMLALFAMFSYWAHEFESGMSYFLGSAY
ncbi:MAG: flagellar biosynthetic protein FliR, partial [Alphaproteobacteria bacterium]